MAGRDGCAMGRVAAPGGIAMGYTHYWTQTRDFDVEAFDEVTSDIAAILAAATHRYEIAICDGGGTPHSKPK